MHNLLKKILSLMLVISLISAIALPVLAKEEQKDTEEAPALREFRIGSVNTFLDFAERCRIDSFSQNMVVYLDEDLDLTDTGFQGIPIFCGQFEGQHHTISGMDLTADGSELGFIRYLTENASVRDLKIQGSISPGGTQTTLGGFVGSNAGTLENCEFDGQITGTDAIGGIAGENTLTGTILRCRTRGSISAEHIIGGIVGDNLGVVRDCDNRAQINISSQDNTVEVTGITLDTLTGTEDPNTVTDVGGIAGTNTGVIRNCSNRGNVGYLHMGYNIGGIAGSHSGYIANCTNYGDIFARKEAGGIAGQFVPVTRIEYSEDVLQILDKQLGSAASALNRATYNAQSNMGAVGAGIGQIQHDAGVARDAISQLLPGPGNFDPDSMLAAKNALSESLYNMRGSVAEVNHALSGTVSQLASDMKAVSGQISAMGKTIREAKEHIGATLTDVSDQDTPEDLTGKIAQCKNLGNISGDINAGGIAGAIAYETDSDPEDELEELGNRSLKADGELRAVIRDCENRGTVTGKKIHVGGIVGRATLGLVRDCVNTGSVEGDKVQYVGGIAGSSQGYIRNCCVKSMMTGASCLGGIAGSGSIVTDCLSMVYLEDATERQGAILGIRGEVREEGEKDPIRNNFYMSMGKTDPGAIDGVSYKGQAEPMARRVFLSQKDLPLAFQNAVLTFRQEDGREKELTLPVGSILRENQIPKIDFKEGYNAHWENIEEYAGQRIHFDAVFKPVYDPIRVTIRSQAARPNGRPVLLAEGEFPELDLIDLTPLENPQAPGKVLESWNLPDLGQSGDIVYHYSQPDDKDPDYLQVFLRNPEGKWREVPCTVNLSSLVFTASPGDNALAVARKTDYRPLLKIGGAVLLVGCIAGAVIYGRKRKKAGKNKKNQK